MIPNQTYISNKDLTIIVEELIYSVLPLSFCIIAVIFEAYSSFVVYSLIVLSLVGSVMLVIHRIRSDWADGKLAGIMTAVGFFGWYAFPASINLISEGTPYREILPVSIDAKTIILGLIYLFLFLVAWILASGFFNRIRFFPAMYSDFSGNVNPKLMAWLGGGCCLVGFLPYVLSGLSVKDIVFLIFQGRLVDKPWIHWENLGNLHSAYLYLSHSVLVAGACILWTLTQDKTLHFNNKLVIGLGALIVTSVVFFDYGTRSVIALIVLPFLFIKFYDVWRRGNYRFMVVASVVGFVFFLILQFQLYYRGSGSVYDIAVLPLYKYITLEDTTDLFSETLFSIKIVPSLHDYFKESVIAQFLASPVPRFLWPSKPVSEVVWFYTLHRWGIDIFEGGGNVFPGIVGQFYMSWGWLGPIFLGIGLGWLTSRVDEYLKNACLVSTLHHRTVGLMISVWILLSFRVASPGFVYPIVIVYLLTRLSSSANSLIRKNYNVYL